MTDYSERLVVGSPLRKAVIRFGAPILMMVPLVALILQLYLPHLSEYFGYLDLPLLVTVYFSLMRHSQVQGILLGALMGIAQDALSAQPLGLFGIVKTLVGYFAASVSQRFDVDNPAIRLSLCFFFYVFHQFFFWVEARSLLGLPLPFDVRQTLVAGVLNAAIALPLFALLDRFRQVSEAPLRIAD